MFLSNSQWKSSVGALLLENGFPVLFSKKYIASSILEFLKNHTIIFHVIPKNILKI